MGRNVSLKMHLRPKGDKGDVACVTTGTPPSFTMAFNYSSPLIVDK